MNRRSFLSALGRLGAAVVASPLAAMLPERTLPRRDPKTGQFVPWYWPAPRPPHYVLKYIPENVQFSGNRFRAPLEDLRQLHAITDEAYRKLKAEIG